MKITLLCRVMNRLEIRTLQFMSSQTPNAPSGMTIEEVRKKLAQYVQIHQSFGRQYIDPDRGHAVPQSKLPVRSPKDSFTQCYVPIWDPKERPYYLTSNGGVRLGRLLEDMDILAGVICYRHDKNPALEENETSPYAFVTLHCDKIEHVDPQNILTAERDIHLNGKVTWSGKSTLECTMNIEQEVRGNLEKVITARYMMAARNPAKLSAGTVNPLQPETEEEKELFKIGEEKRKRRLENDKMSLLNSPPTDEERRIIHELYLSTIVPGYLNEFLGSSALNCYIYSGDSTGEERRLPQNSVWMEDTVIKTVTRCHPEDLSVYNRIFGGSVMMRALELASTTASFFARCQPKVCKTIDDVQFLKPVECGDVLHLCSAVVYSKNRDVQVHVKAEVMRPESGYRTVTNDFHFTFDTGLDQVPKVAPKTYADSMRYLVGKRHYEGGL